MIQEHKSNTNYLNIYKIKKIVVLIKNFCAFFLILRLHKLMHM